MAIKLINEKVSEKQWTRGTFNSLIENGNTEIIVWKTHPTPERS